MASSKVMSNSEQEMQLEFIGVNDIKKGAFAMLQQNPCKVVEISKSAPGKHGSAKLRVIGMDIFSGKKYEHIFNSSALVQVPVVSKNEYRIFFVLDDNYLKLQNVLNPSDVRDDLKLTHDDKELSETISKIEDEADRAIIVTVMSWMNHEKISSFRVIREEDP